MIRTLFDWILRFLIVFLPFSTVISVFLVYRVGIPWSQFIKEILLFFIFLLCFLLLLEKWRKTKKFPLQLGWLDGIIITYIIWMVAITLPTTGLSGLIYGGRYDLIFLLVFLCLYHGYEFLSKPFSYYLKLFLISGGIMLFLSGLLKWPLSEDILLWFGYSGNPSAWQFGSAPPIFHWVDGANVRRFQGLLDGPNTMGAYVIFFFWVFLYYSRRHKDWYFVIGIISIVLVMMVMYTYSRSAWIGLAGAGLLMILASMKSLYKRYKLQSFVLFAVLWVVIGYLYVHYTTQNTAVINRTGSNIWHFERIIFGWNRFLSHPIGQGMGSAGPAYRHVQDLKWLSHDEVEKIDYEYIPESWFVQQCIEGGIIWWALFFIIIGALGILLLLFHPFLWAAFGGVAAMNLVLHTYESSVVSYTIFIIIWIILGYAKSKRKKSR